MLEVDHHRVVAGGRGDPHDIGRAAAAHAEHQRQLAGAQPVQERVGHRGRGTLRERRRGCPVGRRAASLAACTAAITAAMCGQRSSPSRTTRIAVTERLDAATAIRRTADSGRGAGSRSGAIVMPQPMPTRPSAVAMSSTVADDRGWKPAAMQSVITSRPSALCRRDDPRLVAQVGERAARRAVEPVAARARTAAARRGRAPTRAGPGRAGAWAAPKRERITMSSCPRRTSSAPVSSRIDASRISSPG